MSKVDLKPIQQITQKLLSNSSFLHNAIAYIPFFTPHTQNTESTLPSFFSATSFKTLLITTTYFEILHLCRMWRYFQRFTNQRYSKRSLLSFKQIKGTIHILRKIYFHTFPKKGKKM